ncbi:MAG TPA: MobA/MobL family protein [Rhodanobacter sp.]
MVQHARPHLQVHSRGNDHSAVAGAAYRLGLRLYDVRAKKWHDFRRRKLGEEIVRALTIAPEGAPDWASDPGELWNRAEAAEKRKDAQVARDYRIPIPLGLSDQVAGDMAEAMARFIADELHTAVSIGLHRDAEIDALGNVKPNHQQGFHAHLYFPTRRLQEIAQEDGSSAWGLGEKLMILSSKQTGGAFVERLNEHWALLANRFTSANDLPADYDHRSYVRQEVPIAPQPTLGAAVTAMERKGFFTRRGDALRGDILVPAKVYEAAHAVVVDAQWQQAIEDAIRERTNPAARAARLAAEASAPPAAPQPAPVTAAPIEQPPLPKPPLTAPAGSLVAQFHAAAPAPNTLEERQVFVRVLKIVGVVERVLAALTALAERFRRHAEDRGRRMAAKLDVTYELDQARSRRATAKEKLEKWETGHRWQVLATRALGGSEAAKPRAWVTLLEQFEACQCRVQSLKAAIRSHQIHLDKFTEDEVVLTREQTETQERLRAAVGTMVALDQGSVEPLLSVTSGVELEWLRAHMPDMGQALDEVAQAAEPGEAAARLRPAGRRMVGTP